MDLWHPVLLAAGIVAGVAIRHLWTRRPFRVDVTVRHEEKGEPE